MSLLDKASLVQIPSGYGDGKLYSVKPTPTYGSELITNGDFSSDSDWSLGSGWSIGSGSLNAIGAGNYAVQTNVLAQNTNAILKVQWTQTITSGTRLRFFARNYNDGGSETVLSGSATDGGVYSNSNCVGSGTYTIYVSVTNGYSFKLLAESGNNATVDNVSVKEILVADGDFDFSRSSSGTRVNAEGLIEVASVLGSEEVTNGDFATDSDWTKGSGWTISGGKATKSGTDLAYLTQSSLISVIGKTYRVKASITNVTTGNIRIDNFTSGTTYTSNIEIDITYTATSAGVFRFLGWGGFDGSIDNVSVKEVIENDVPRLDYSDGSCASLLLEPQSTNLLPYSEDFSQWGQIQNISLTSNATTSPSGTANGTKVLSNNNNSKVSFVGLSFVAGTSYTISVFCKNIDATSLNFFIYMGGAGGDITYDFTSQVNTSDWTRVSYTFVATGTNSQNQVQFARMLPSGESAFFWGFQVEQQSYATSYIPTSGSTVTRTADVCNNAGTSATFSDSEGVLFFEGSALSDGTNQRWIAIGSGSNANRVSIHFNATNRISCSVRGSSSAIYDADFNIGSQTNNTKAAIKYKDSDYAFFVNGVKVDSQQSGSLSFNASLSELSFDSADGGSPFYGKTKQLMVFDEALSDAELSDLTGQVNTSFAQLANFYNYTIL